MSEVDNRRKGLLDIILERVQGVRAPIIAPQASTSARREEAVVVEAPPVEEKKPPARPKSKSRASKTKVKQALMAAVAWGRIYENASLADGLGQKVDELLGTEGQAAEVFAVLKAAPPERRDELTEMFVSGLLEILEG